MQLEVVYRTDQEICGIWGPVVIRIVDGASTERPEIDRVRELLTRVLAEWPSMGMLLIAHHGTPQPSLTAMRYSKILMDDIEPRLVIGITLLGLGFWAAAARATASLLMRMTRGNGVMLESSVEATVRRMALELVGLDAEGLLAASNELERRFRART